MAVGLQIYGIGLVCFDFNSECTETNHNVIFKNLRGSQGSEILFLNCLDVFGMTVSQINWFGLVCFETNSESIELVWIDLL